jgi:hypothetical protein
MQLSTFFRGSGCKAATVLCFDFLIYLRLVLFGEWRKSRCYSLCGENTSLFDYVHDNNFCLVVGLPFIFWYVMFNNFVLFKKMNPAAAFGKVIELHPMFSSQGSSAILQCHIHTAAD